MSIDAATHRGFHLPFINCLKRGPIWMTLFVTKSSRRARKPGSAFFANKNAAEVIDMNVIEPRRCTVEGLLTILAGEA